MPQQEFQSAAGAASISPGHYVGSVSEGEVDVTVLAFAQWISELRARSNLQSSQLLAEMGIIRSGITTNNNDLSEFKRQISGTSAATQNQVNELREKLGEAFSEISLLRKEKAQFEAETSAEVAQINEQLHFKTIEFDTLKKAHGAAHQQLQQHVVQLQTEVNELRIKHDDSQRSLSLLGEQSFGKTSELEVAGQHNANEMKRLRVDHDQAIANLADNMNKWNDTIRDLSREFHEFQKLMTQQQQKLQTNFYEFTGRQSAAQASAGASDNTNNALGPGSYGVKPTYSGGYVLRQGPQLGFPAQMQPPQQRALAPRDNGHQV